MIPFWLSAAGLIALTLLFVLPPLFSRRGGGRGDPDRDQLALALFHRRLQELDLDLAAGTLDRRHYRAARRDLEQELLRDVPGTATEDPPDAGGGRWTAALLAVLLPTVAVSLYLHLGNSALIPRLEAAATTDTRAPAAPGGNPPPLEVMIQRLADKLAQHPDNLEGWMMLGRTYFAIGQPQKALLALERAYRLGPDNPDVLVAYAEAIAAVNHSELAGRPAELIQAALKIDPKHTSARWLAGLVSFQATRYSRAAEQWEALVATFDPNGKEAAELTRYIAEARGRAGSDLSGRGARTDTEKPTTPQPAPATTGTIRIEISLAEPLWPQANINDPIFIYAKAVAGPPMPLAARRARVADLPVTLILDDSMAIDPAMKLSGFPEVTLIARIAKSGQAMPQSGDLEGEVSPVEPGRAGIVKILIDRVRP